MKVWLQSADMSCFDHDNVDENDAVQLYRNYDWQREADLERRLEDRGKNYGPSGYGLVDTAGNILVIHRSVWEQTLWVRLILKSDFRLLGVIPMSRSKTFESTGVAIEDAELLIGKFFENPKELLELPGFVESAG